MVMNIRVLTPDRVICSTTADEVILPGLTGQVGVLDGHATLITALDTGLLRIKLADPTVHLSLSPKQRQFVQVYRNLLPKAEANQVFANWKH